MKLDAQFVCSAFALDDCPRWNRAEVAFAGRSNVGKSSLINALTGVKGLARTSATPGRTRCLNFFALGDDLALVDLPGFGFARLSAREAEKLGVLMRTYINRGPNLAALVLLIDLRRGPRDDELALAEMIRRRGCALVVVGTKCDKLRRAEIAPALERFAPIGASPLCCSTLSGAGLLELNRLVVRYVTRENASDGAR